MELDYEIVIGLEVHVELNTKTKIFCGCTTDFHGEPNTHTCPVCTGMPGTLPVLNKQVVNYAIGVGLATNCSITQFCKFDRKNYFYPDNPQNYQISQLYLPICRNGGFDITTDKETKRIGIHEIHMEEDAGKLIHDDFDDCSLVDFNRSGVPLVEIVTEPDMRSAEDVQAFLEQLRGRILYLGASNCKLEEGSMRVDVNLSIREKGAKEFGTRTETKNLNSFKAIARSIKAETERQIDLLAEGKEVVQETRRWDDNEGKSYSMRSKENAQDYRYFPDPDLLPISISDEWIEEIRGLQPEFREEKTKRYIQDFSLSEKDVAYLTEYISLAHLFEETVKLYDKPKKVANWLISDLNRIVNEKGLAVEDVTFTPKHLVALIELIDSGKLNSTIARTVFEQILLADVDPEKYAQENNLLMSDNDDELKEIVLKILADNPDSVEELRNGKDKVISFLIGQAMKALKGKSNPNKITEIIRKEVFGE